MTGIPVYAGGPNPNSVQLRAGDGLLAAPLNIALHRVNADSKVLYPIIKGTDVKNVTNRNNSGRNQKGQLVTLW